MFDRTDHIYTVPNQVPCAEFDDIGDKQAGKTTCCKFHKDNFFPWCDF